MIRGRRPIKKSDDIILQQGDCMRLLEKLPERHFDSVVTDTPYNTKLMNKSWDSNIAFRISMWMKVLEVMKPGAFLLAFGGPRTYHRMACAAEDAGFFVHDSIVWVYASGMVKGKNLYKATGLKKWKGWSSQIKPGHENIMLAQKPFKGSIANNVIKWGVGGLNIDGCRIPSGGDYRKKCESAVGLDSSRTKSVYGKWKGKRTNSFNSLGRMPSNVVLSHHEKCKENKCHKDCPIQELDRQSGVTKSQGIINRWKDGAKPFGGGAGHEYETYNVRTPDVGGASRFFYHPKAPQKERVVNGVRLDHPTIKPIGLLRWLVRLVTPPGGVVLDPFMGTGTTIIAAHKEGFQSVGMELEKEHYQDAIKKIKYWIRRK